MKPAPTAPSAANLPAARASGARLIAVLDIGATAIRMEVAEVDANGLTRTLEALSLPVGLGKDTFSAGRLRKETIEDCVAKLRRFRAVLDEYGIDDPRAVRAVATSAVREAENREQFLNRVLIATGFRVECPDDVELSRLAYFAVRNLLERSETPHPWNELVIEVGGGSTELLLIQDDRVTFSETYRLGSLRVREALDMRQINRARMRALLVRDIQRSLVQMRRDLPPTLPKRLIAMSGDARFAAAQLLPRWDQLELGRISAKAFAQFSERIIAMPAEEIARVYQMHIDEAESVGVALTIYAQIARAFEIREIGVPKIHLRTGLEIEMATRSLWTSDFVRQVENSARLIAEKFHVDLRHAGHVAALCDRLFTALRDEHRLDSRYGILLRIAALLHEAGLFVNSRNHHKHSMYLIQNSDLFGLTQEDILLVALVARYHRRSVPRPTHPFYETLNPERRMAVQALAAILRVADALDRGHTQRVSDVALTREADRMVLTVAGADDLTVERAALREKGDLFEAVYGAPLALERGPAVKGFEGNV